MRERVKEILTSLPPEGVAIHGTNLARAKRIQQMGFVPQNLHPGMPLDSIYYTVQPPNMNKNYAVEQIKEIRMRFREAVLRYARRAASQSLYALSESLDNKIPSLVVFRPLQKFDMTFASNHVSPFPVIASERKMVPKNNIYGIIPVPVYIGEAELIEETLKILSQRGVIGSAKPPQLQKA